MTLYTTYFGGLNSLVHPDDADLILGVVRYPQDFVQRVTDRNVPAVAPPDDLLNAFKTVEEAGDRDGVANPSAAAWRTVDFEDRYRDHLDGAGQQQVLDELRDRAEHRNVWLVCWEKDPRYCHRRVLADVLADDLDAEVVHHPDPADLEEPTDEQDGPKLTSLTEFSGGETA
ncbi:DUF488 domain-containing protein [Halorussus sp. MSC15.2]|uniref:DUF488 domain-containing protein n=1 Tax=Halorussus sp. MSC15.2 TaxID=2283638 RepID=UPI0013D457A1|nr:DUF488 domain-containing protein [Halorussus sp. MSC15.2]NEU56762.1 DUF488 domain-containing protein [Halorussus sp. MSC15.2]